MRKPLNPGKLTATIVAALARMVLAAAILCGLGACVNQDTQTSASLVATGPVNPSHAAGQAPVITARPA